MIKISTKQTLEAKKHNNYSRWELWFKKNKPNFFQVNELEKFCIISDDTGDPEGCSIFYSQYFIYLNPMDFLTYLSNEVLFTQYVDPVVEICDIQII
jgi:hypothetical protein